MKPRLTRQLLQSLVSRCVFLLATAFAVSVAVGILAVLSATGSEATASLNGTEVSYFKPASVSALIAFFAATVAVSFWLGIRWAWLKYGERAVPRLLDLPASALQWGPVVLFLCLPVVAIGLYKGVLIDFESAERHAVRKAYDEFDDRTRRAIRASETTVAGDTYKDPPTIKISSIATPRSALFFGEIQRTALRAGASELEGMHALERAWILASRAMFTADELSELTSTEFADEFHSRLRRVDIPVALYPYASADVELIKIDGDVAYVYANGNETDQMGVLHHNDDGEWLLDFPDSFSAWCEQFSRRLAARRMSDAHVDHLLFRVYRRARSNTGAMMEPLPKAAMEGPLDYDLSVGPPITERPPDREPSPPKKPTVKELIDKELQSPVTYDAYLDSVSRKDYLRAIFERKLVTWDSSVVWDAVKYDKSWLAFSLAYEAAKLDTEASRVEALRRGFESSQNFWYNIIQLIREEPSSLLAPDLVAYYESNPRAVRYNSEVIYAMGKCADDRVREILEARATDSTDHMRSVCAEALAWSDLNRGVELLKIHASDPDLGVAMEARGALHRLGYTFDKED